jgi:hypothetical protein
MGVSGYLHSCPLCPREKSPRNSMDEGMEINNNWSSERGNAADRPAPAMNRTQILCRKLALHTELTLNVWYNNV